MPLINLIAEQRSATRAQEGKARSIVFGALGLAGLGTLAAIWFMVQATGLNGQASALETKKIKLKGVMDAVKKNEADLAALTPRLKTLTDAQTDTQKWAGVLTHLTTNTPQGVWLTNVRTQPGDKTKATTVTFNGQSLTQDSVGGFILRLEASDQLENVSLRFTQQRAGAQTVTLEFEVTADVTGTKPKPKPEENKQA